MTARGLLCLVACACSARAERPPLPALVASEPPAGAAAVPTTAWIVLTLASPPPPELTGDDFHLSCGDRSISSTISVLPVNRVVIDPVSPLPAAARCRLRWSGGSLELRTADAGGDAIVPFDRDDAAAVLPFPDDVFTVEDAASPTGRRLALAVPPRSGTAQALGDAVIAAAGVSDGFSPLGAWIVPLPAAPDEGSLPMTVEASLETLASVGLFDLASGARVPFALSVRRETPALVVWPRPLDPGGRYALVVTRRALVDASHPLAASPFLARALAPESATDTPAVRRVRANLAPLLALPLRPPLQREDVAVALVATVRSTAELASDVVAIRDQLDARAWTAPPLTVTPVDDPAHDVVAVVSATWEVPIWVDELGITRDARGIPESRASEKVALRIALPRAALQGRAPLVMYQHGSPGTADEAVEFARTTLAERGFAVAGFTDRFNRSGRREASLAEQILALIRDRSAGAQQREMWSEQLAFLRLLRTLAALDVLPVGAPDGIPDLDLGKPLAYVGVSAGGVYGLGLLPYSPELHAAALWVGAGRSFSQPDADSVVALAPSFGVAPADAWWMIAVLQIALDADHPLVHARLLRDAATSVLLGEGLADPHTPPRATRDAAWQIGAAQLAPAADPVFYLRQAPSPLAGNVDPTTTRAYAQYVPPGVPGMLPTPSCVFAHKDGHDCPQSLEGRRQIADFLRSALVDPAPVATDAASLCQASCAGRLCGPDDCGATCGPGCAPGQGCDDAGQRCIDPTYAGNDRCEAALVIAALPFTHVGTTAGAAPDYDPKGAGCLPHTVEGGPDVVFAFKPAVDGRLEARLRPTAELASCTGANKVGEACNPTRILVTTDCAAATCVASFDYWREPDGKLRFDAVAGRTYYLIVAGYWAAEVGSYTLTVSAAPPAPARGG